MKRRKRKGKKRPSEDLGDFLVQNSHIDSLSIKFEDTEDLYLKILIISVHAQARMS